MLVLPTITRLKSQRNTRSDMPAKKKEPNKIEKPKKKLDVSDIIMGTGRRKTAVASVWLKSEKGSMVVNGKPIEKYFPGEAAKKVYEEPLRIVNRLGQFSGSIKVRGGGTNGQLEAVVHGLSRALVAFDPSFKEILSKRKFLTRDSRRKEKRKYGHAGKAR